MKLIRLFLTAAILLVCAKTNSKDLANAQALYIFNFIRYVKWPDNNVNHNFVIGVIGESAIINELVTLSNNKKVGSQSIVVKKITDYKTACECQLIFIPTSRKHLIKELSTKIGDKPILLISESPNTSECAIEFVYPDNKLHFKVNEENVRHQNLYMSQKLINLAYKI